MVLLLLASSASQPLHLLTSAYAIVLASCSSTVVLHFHDSILSDLPVTSLLPSLLSYQWLLGQPHAS